MSKATELTLRERATDWHTKFVVEERYVEAAERRRMYVGATTLIVVGLVGFLYLVTSVLTHSGFELLDRPVERWFDAQRSGATTGFMITLAIVFGPIALPIIVLVVLVVWIIAARHVWRPFLLFCGMV